MNRRLGRTLKRPPALVVNAARRAFRERLTSGARHAELVFDSFADLDETFESAPRMLMFSADGFDLLLTITREPRGDRVEAAVLTPAKPVEVSIRRPTRATIALRATPDGYLAPTTLPPGTASVYARASDGRAWQTDWLTI
jgi:hypothetical protein